MPYFNEDSLENEIIGRWGSGSANHQVYKALQKERDELKKTTAKYKKLDNATQEQMMTFVNDRFPYISKKIMWGKEATALLKSFTVRVIKEFLDSAKV